MRLLQFISSSMRIGAGARRSRRGGAFTLIELMVVIGIIAVLMGIMLPTLRIVRQRGATVQCASNLRQIAAGVRMYVEANRGMVPPFRTPVVAGTRNLYDYGIGPQYRPRWYELLAAPTKVFAFRTASPADDDDREVESAIFVCPTVPDWKNARNLAYGYNYQFLGNPRPRAGNSKKYINFPVNMARIRASQTVLATDSMGTAAGKVSGNRRAYLGNGGRDQNAWGNHGYTIDPPRLTATSDYCEWRHRNPHDRSAPDPRHAGRTNVAYCDGHVETQTMAELGYYVAHSGRVEVDDHRTRNNLFSGSGQDDDPPPVN